MKPIILVIVLALCCTSCRGAGYKKFYEARLDLSDPAQASSVIPLEEGGEPELIQSTDPSRDLRALIADHYVVVGQSSFVGRQAGVGPIRKQAKRVRATKVLHRLQYKRTASGTMDLPSTTTTYTSGNVYSGSQIGSYSGTSTTLDSTPFTFRFKLYSHEAWFLVRDTTRPRIGLSVVDLTEGHRKESGRNAGAAIWVVFNDSAAFAANLVPGDVIVAIDGEAVADQAEALEAMRSIPADVTTCEFTVIRRGEEETITVEGI